MSDTIFEWVKEFGDVDASHIHPEIRKCVQSAISQWVKKDKFGFSYNLYASGLSKGEIVYFAMREYVGSENAEKCFWEDLQRYFNGTFDFKFYNIEDYPEDLDEE